MQQSKCTFSLMSVALESMKSDFTDNFNKLTDLLAKTTALLGGSKLEKGLGLLGPAQW